MAKTIQRIISYKATDNNKSFCLSVKNDNNTASVEMYYADIEDYLNVSRYSYNKGCLRDSTNNEIYSALYNAKDLYFKSALYGNNVDSTLPNTHAFQNIFNYKLSSDLSNQIQVENYIYQLNNMSNYGKMLFSQDIYSELSLNNGYAKMPNVNISTLLFDKDNLNSAKADDSVQVIPKENISNILYNQFFEIPGIVKNDYDSGNYCANIYTTKNQYTSQYDMTHSNGKKLSNARQYVAIDHCNNQIYLKYYDNVDYNQTSVSTINQQGLYGHKYQKVEVLKALNRFEAINVHKTNYYDINIVCEKLLASFNTAQLNVSESKKQQIEIVKKNLKHEIQNCIQDICKQISPVDTQLVKVNILDSEIQ